VFGPRNPKTENHDVQAAKVEVAKFFNQTDTERFFRPIVDILKLELLKTKKLEILESGNDDAQQAFDKLQDEIKSIKFAQTGRAGPHVGKSNRMSLKSLLANRTTP
jgi:phosphotransferase system HPr-like phosphotransfer protein